MVGGLPLFLKYAQRRGNVEGLGRGTLVGMCFFLLALGNLYEAPCRGLGTEMGGKGGGWNSDGAQGCLAHPGSEQSEAWVV